MTQMVSDIGEFELIERIEKIINSESVKTTGLILGIGDDAAAFRPEQGYEILVTSDSMLEGRHYLKGHITPFDLGRRAMVMNISDIGAMGGTPLYATVSLGLHPSTLICDVEEIYRGIISELKPFNASIIGGNTTRVDNHAFIDITLIGKAEKERLILRSTAMPGDIIMVTGFPGQSAAGYLALRNNKQEMDFDYGLLIDSYLRPCHRAREGVALARERIASSMIDISDGLAGDLYHICEKSRVGLELNQKMLPLNDPLESMAHHCKMDKYELIMGPSDDYELIFTCPPEKTIHASDLLSEFNCTVTPVGKIIPLNGGMNIILENGTREVILKKGWDHFK